MCRRDIVHVETATSAAPIIGNKTSTMSYRLKRQRVTITRRKPGKMAPSAAAASMVPARTVTARRGFGATPNQPAVSLVNPLSHMPVVRQSLGTG